VFLLIKGSPIQNQRYPKKDPGPKSERRRSAAENQQ
jgi:hypothetical protein